MIMQIVLISTFEIKLIFLEPLLEDKAFFNLSNAEGTQLQSKVNQMAVFPKLLSILMIGIL